MKFGALALLIALALGAWPAYAARAAARPTDAGAACSRGTVVRVPGRGRLQVFAVQFKQDIAATASVASIDAQVECTFARDVAPYRDRRVPGLVVFNELTAIAFGLEGPAGAPARAFADTPAGTQLGYRSGEPLGALGGAIGLALAAHAPAAAFYAARFPSAPATLSRAFLALTDTYVRTVWDSFAAAARRYRVTVVVGVPLPTFSTAAACARAGFRGWVACPGWSTSTDPSTVALLGGSDGSVEVADTPAVENDVLEFGPTGQLVDLQPKVNLTPIETQIGFTPAPIASVHALGIPGAAGVRAGVAISLDAFQHEPTAHPCASPADYVGCLASRGVNLLLQPEFNDGTAQCASWSTYAVACGGPSWQPLSWMLSSWYDVRHFPFAYAVNPFMVGNLYDLTGDGQSAIFARDDPRARSDAYVGDVRPISRYPDPASLIGLNGEQPGFLALEPGSSMAASVTIPTCRPERSARSNPVRTAWLPDRVSVRDRARRTPTGPACSWRNCVCALDRPAPFAHDRTDPSRCSRVPPARSSACEPQPADVRCLTS